MSRLPVYLDYQATTPVDPAVRDAMLPYLNECFGNPHSVEHEFGWKASDAIKGARARVANFINANDDEIVFTSGATESCNLAIRGIAQGANGGGRNRIVTLSTEHPAVLETVLDLGRIGMESVVLPVDCDGLLNLDLFERAVDERTLLVSVMAANNEIGVIQPISRLAALCHAVGAVFHTDATQAAGCLDIDVENWQADLVSFTGHKIYGPKGIGALFVRSGLRLTPMLTGGSHERGARAGTLPTPLIVGFGLACELAGLRREHDQARIRVLSERLYSGLRETYPSVQLFGHAQERLPGNLNIGIPGLPADVIIRNVSNRLAISSGSACASSAAEPSRVLMALGLEREVAETGVRISLGRFTTEEDVATAVNVLSSLSFICQRSRT